jgi:hypothetical protein
MNAKKDKFFQMRVDEHFLQRLDDFRRTAPDLPSRTEMARRLIEAAFELADKDPQSIALPALGKLHALVGAPRRVSSSESRPVSIAADEGPHLVREKRIRGRP